MCMCVRVCGVSVCVCGVSVCVVCLSVYGFHCGIFFMSGFLNNANSIGSVSRDARYDRSFGVRYGKVDSSRQKEARRRITRIRKN